MDSNATALRQLFVLPIFLNLILSLQLRDQPVIVSMGANPEPNDGITFPNPERAVMNADSDRIDRHGRMHLLEAQT